MMDNATRRAFAAEAIATYRTRRTFCNDGGYRHEPDDAVIGDMLTDLRHFCAAHDINFAAKIVSSEVNFESEK